MTPKEIISSITERVKDTANVKVVFGDPVESGGVTVIPVASVKVAGGGGGGRGRGVAVTEEGVEVEGGVGMGLQITARPLGYIEVVNGSAKLVPIVDVTKIAIGSMIAGTLALLTVGRRMAKRAKMLQA
ncbi:MAG TPA: hypothetical protein VFT58_05820 [Nitrososphaera sp.]|nr:hypothetical protein [Nitrososphaera sp.]